MTLSKRASNARALYRCAVLAAPAALLKVRGNDGEPVAYVRAAGTRWAYGLSRTGRSVGVAQTQELAAVAARDLAEALTPQSGERSAALSHGASRSGGREEYA